MGIQYLHVYYYLDLSGGLATITGTDCYFTSSFVVDEKSTSGFVKAPSFIDALHHANLCARKITKICMGIHYLHV